MDTNRKEQILRISGAAVQKCMRCGKCSACCPSYGEMEYHPHQFVAMTEAGRIEELLRSDSLYKCLSCFACVERCPRGVEPARVVEAIRMEAVRIQGNNRLIPDRIPSLLDENTPQQLLMTALRKYAR